MKNIHVTVTLSINFCRSFSVEHVSSYAVVKAIPQVNGEERFGQLGIHHHLARFRERTHRTLGKRGGLALNTPQQNVFWLYVCSYRLLCFIVHCPLSNRLLPQNSYNVIALYATLSEVNDDDDDDERVGLWTDFG